jgi:hypothetical protein
MPKCSDSGRSAWTDFRANVSAIALNPNSPNAPSSLAPFLIESARLPQFLMARRLRTPTAVLSLRTHKCPPACPAYPGGQLCGRLGAGRNIAVLLLRTRQRPPGLSSIPWGSVVARCRSQRLIITRRYRSLELARQTISRGRPTSPVQHTLGVQLWLGAGRNV